MDKINIALSKAVSQLRHNANISQEELAHRAGIHRTYVSQIERGLKSPTLHVLIQIANSLNTVASEIMRDVEKGIE